MDDNRVQPVTLHLRQRDVAVDMLRVFSCCAVVGLHTFSRGVTPLASIMYYACGFAVPLFFMTSGFFLLNRGGVTYSYALRKIGRMITVICLWVAIATFPRALALAVLGGGLTAFASWPAEFLVSLAGTVVQTGMLPQLWFLWSLAIVYLLLPILSRLSFYGKKQMCFLLCVAGLVIQIASYVKHFPLESYVPQVFRTWIWVKYFLLGGLLYQIRDRIGFSKLMAFLLILAVTVLAVCWQLFAGSILIPEPVMASYAEYFYDDLLYVLWTAVFLLAAESLRPTSNLWVRVSSLTMGVYIIHMLVFRLLSHFINFNNPIFGSGTGYLVVLVVSFACVRAIKLTKLFDFLCRL